MSAANLRALHPHELDVSDTGIGYGTAFGKRSRRQNASRQFGKRPNQTLTAGRGTSTSQDTTSFSNNPFDTLQERKLSEIPGLL